MDLDLHQDGDVDLSVPGDENDKYPDFFGESSAVNSEDEKYPNYFNKRVDAVAAKPAMQA